MTIKDRCKEIEVKEFPKGWTREYRSNLTGRCWWKRKHLAYPEPKTAKSLYIFLHEVAHAKLRHQSKPSYVREYEAETFAHEKMREYGFVVPLDMTNRAKKYVARKLKAGLRSGLKQEVDPKIQEFCEV